MTVTERILTIADQIVVISDGEVRESGPKSKILPSLLNTDKDGCEWCPKKGEK